MSATFWEYMCKIHTVHWSQCCHVQSVVLHCLSHVTTDTICKKTKAINDSQVLLIRHYSQNYYFYHLYILRSAALIINFFASTFSVILHSYQIASTLFILQCSHFSKLQYFGLIPGLIKLWSLPMMCLMHCCSFRTKMLQVWNSWA